MTETESTRIKNMVKDKTVSFSFYRDGNLWYSTECGFEFPVPIEDTGSATFLATDRAMLFMRYIRRHVRLLKMAGASRTVTVREYRPEPHTCTTADPVGTRCDVCFGEIWL